MDLSTLHRDLVIRQRIFKIMLLSVIPAMLANFRHREFGDSSVDLQVFLKLGFWAVCMAICAYFYRLWIGKFARIDNFLLIPFFGLMFVSCLYAPSMAYSAGAAFSVLSLVIIFYASSSVLSYSEVLKIILGVLISMTILGLIAYVALPDIGRTKEWVGNNLVPTKRLAGINGANGTGFIAALSILIAAGLNYKNLIRKNIYYISMSISIIALLGSNSKTSTFALLAALSIIYFSKLHLHRLAFLFSGLAAAIALAFIIDFDAVFALLSRSGNPEENMTGTGRVYIWKVVTELIQQKPFTGWGFASGAFIIPKYANEIGHTPPHAHNTFLQTTFAMGIFGLLLYAMIFIVKLVYTIKMQDRFKLSLIIFLLIHGLTEASIFQSIAGITTIAFCLMMALEYQPEKSTDQGGEVSGFGVSDTRLSGSNM